MPTPIRILVLEDRPDDVELMLRELRRAGFAPDWQCVETEAAYLELLEQDFDVILSDFTMPSFDALRALELLQERELDIPFIVITGTVGRIAPVATLEGGVVYYDVTIGLTPTDLPIRADMTANATILVDEIADVLVIPTWVVRVDRSTGQTYVHRRVGDGVERVDVELGARYGGRVQVLGGLSEGDELVWVQESTPFGFGGQ